MKNNLDFQMVCYDCGNFAIKFENPTSASRATKEDYVSELATLR